MPPLLLVTVATTSRAADVDCSNEQNTLDTLRVHWAVLAPSNKKRTMSNHVNDSGRCMRSSLWGMPLLLLLVTAATASRAAGTDCSNDQNTLDIVACHEGRYAIADKHLNAVYSAAMKNLEESQKIALKKSQLAWIKYRDLNYALVAEMNKDSGTYAGVAISDFRASLVEKRVKEFLELFSGPGERPEWLK